MRIAHITDIHFMEHPPLGRLLGKRLLGSANLYLAGRRHHFHREVQLAAVRQLVELQPDLLIITGDLTAQALPTEFAVARAALDPALSSAPSLVIPGNHDVYTQNAQHTQRIREEFSEFMHLEGSIGRLDGDGFTVLGLDPNRPTLLNASGRVPEDQLSDLASALQQAPRGLLVLALHYPLLDRHGEVYDGSGHGLVNARDLISVLDEAPRVPDLIVHGHVHHGYQASLSLSRGEVPIHNCGSSGYAWLPEAHRAAAMNLYEMNPQAASGSRLVQVHRFLHDGERFKPEVGGAYASGR